MRNLQTGVNKLVGKKLINLLCHAKFITSRKVSSLCNQHNYGCACCSSAVKNVHIDLTSVFVTAALLCPCVFVNKRIYAPPQYKCYYLAPPQSLSRKQINTKLMLCKPLFINALNS